MNKFWKWFCGLPFMRAPFSQRTIEESLAVAILAIVDKYDLGPERGFCGSCLGHVGSSGKKLPAVHFIIEVCDSPETCFGPTFVEGVTIQ